MDTSGCSTEEPGQVQGIMMKEYFNTRFAKWEWQNAEITQQNTKIVQQNNESKQGLVQSPQRVKELEVRIHQIQERNTTGIGTSYLEAASRGSQTTEGPANRPNLTPPKVEELFCTVGSGRVEGDEINMAMLGKKIEEEIQKINQTFQCKAITQDHRTQDRVQILCRNEEELDTVKRVATTTAVEGAKVLRDQLYLIKLNNVRANAVLSNGVIKEDLLPALNDSNKTQIAKISRLSGRCSTYQLRSNTCKQ